MSDTRESYTLILSVDQDNSRYVESTVGTDTDDAVNGSIQITETGQANYIVYGQSSDSNLDPNDASVIGVYEKGVCFIQDGETYFESNITTPADENYYE